jgi:hypothetical protein
MTIMLLSVLLAIIHAKHVQETQLMRVYLAQFQQTELLHRMVLTNVCVKAGIHNY